MLLFTLKSVAATTETEAALDAPLETFALPTVERLTPFDVLPDLLPEATTELDVTLEFCADRLVDSITEPEAPLDTLFDRFVEATVEEDVDFEAFSDKAVESDSEELSFITTTDEISCEFCSARKSTRVTSRPSGVIKLGILSPYALFAIDCAVEISVDCDKARLDSVERFVLVTTERLVDRLSPAVKLVAATVERLKPLESPADSFVEATLETLSAVEVVFEESVDSTRLNEVARLSPPLRFVEATVETDSTLESLAESFAKTAVLTDKAFD